MSTTPIMSGISTVLGPVAPIDAADGIALVPSPAPLQRSNWFDGKFLRAAHLQAEQEYMLRVARLVGMAGGGGVVNGFDVALSGSGMTLGAGFAIDDLGRPLLLPTAAKVDLDKLVMLATGGNAVQISRTGADAEFGDCFGSTDIPTGGQVVTSSDWWVVTIGYGESLCGEEDVYGRLCENACETTTERPYTVEGVVVRVERLALGVPLPVSTAVPLSTVHLPSRLASAYFDDERRRGGDLRSRSGLTASTWCHSASLNVRSTVPIAVLIRSGSTNVRLDPWVVRRERIDVPPSRFWAGVMGLRPWNVFLSQVLQFQCQLREVPLAAGPQGPDDPCENKTAAIGVAAQFMDDLAAILAKPDAKNVLTLMGEGRFQHLRDVLVGASGKGKGATQALLEYGFVELPPAGFLPVEPASGIGVEDQVRRMMGKGVDLRFLTARADVVAQAFAESQHLARISLIRGLDDPTAPEPVDVFVPDAVMRTDAATSGPLSFGTRVSILPSSPHEVVPTPTGFMLGGEAKAASAAMAGVTTVALGSSVSLSFAGAAPLPRSVGVGFAALAGLAGREGDDAGGEEARRLLRDFQIRRAAEDDHDPLAAVNRLSLNQLAANARQFMAALPEEPRERLGEFAPALSPTDTRFLAGWVAVDIQADLRTVETGERIPLQSNVIGASPARSNQIDEFSLQDSLEVTQATVISANQRRVVSRLNGVTVEHTFVSLGHPTQTDRVRLDAELIITLEIDGTRLTSFTVDAAVKRHPGPVSAEVEERNIISPTRFRFTMQLAGEPMHIDARLSRLGGAPSRLLAMAVASTELPLAAAELAEDPEVQKPSNPLNQTARRALDVLAAGLADPGFVDRSAKRLFPPVQTTVTSHLQATRDWVMFQHRADRIAATSAPAPTTLPARSFQVYEATLTEQDTPAVLIEALRANDANTLKRLNVQPIDRVEFSGGTADLQTSALQVLDAWRAAGPGDTIVCGAVALHGQSEGNLEKVRLGRIAEVVSVASSLDPAAAFVLIPDVPAALDVPNTDGVMVFGTTAKKVAKTCVDVRLITVEDLRGVDLKGDRVNELLGAAKRLGRVDFADNAVQGGLDDVIDGWNATGVDAVEVAIALSQRGDPRAGEDAEILGRTSAIVQALGAGVDVNAVQVAGELEADCPVVLILAIVKRPPPPAAEAGAAHVLLAILGGAQAWREIEPRLPEGALTPQVLRNLDRLGISRSLGFREFARGSRDLAPGGSDTIGRLDGLPDRFSQAPVSRRLSIFEAESLNDDIDAVKPQAEFVFDEAGSPGDVDAIRSPVRPLADLNVLDLLIVEAEPG